ncbi:MAG: hypothetical protein KDD76_06355, partial [Rickettsiales bacterium]|nr:hypothetical protein [Rickettsiales bacterium]
GPALSMALLVCVLFPRVERYMSTFGYWLGERISEFFFKHTDGVQVSLRIAKGITCQEKQYA